MRAVRDIARATVVKPRRTPIPRSTTLPDAVQTEMRLAETPRCGRCQEPFKCGHCGGYYVAYQLRPEDASAMRAAFAYENCELRAEVYALEAALFAMVDAALEGESQERAA